MIQVVQNPAPWPLEGCAISLTLTIKKGGLFKKAPNLAELEKQLGGLVHIGGVGDFSLFLDNVPPPAPNGDADYMMYGRTGPIGRGFTLAVRDGGGTLALDCPLPTTTHDLEDFFTAAGALAKAAGARELHEEDAGKVHLAGLTARFAEMRERNGHILKSFAAGGQNLAVGGIYMPIYLPETLCSRMASVPPENAEVFFSAYLDDKQALDYYYMKPSFYKGEDGTVTAGYALTEGVASIIPKEAFIPYPPSPVTFQEVARWLVVMAAPQVGAIGRMPYADFVAALAKSGDVQDFDPRHYTLHGLGQRRMRELLETQGEPPPANA